MMSDICRQLGLIFDEFADFLIYVAEQIDTNTYLNYT